MKWWNKIKEMASRMTLDVSIETTEARSQKLCEAKNWYSRIHYQ